MTENINKIITVFTPTYNRAHTIERLYQSLYKQDCYDFEWLVINDGSTDNTDELFNTLLQHEQPFPIRYSIVTNGGKQRAINEALKIAQGEYFFIVDSDDYLLPNAISFIKNAFKSLPQEEPFIGISGIRGNIDGKPLYRVPDINPATGYIDATNIERPLYGLQADMAEVFYTEKIRKYIFPVWKGEKFTPEAVIWDQMALDGYKLRWFNQIIYICEYQPDGLTNSSWQLLKNNPMGYAMLFNTQLKYKKNIKERCYLTLQFISCCCLAKEYRYINKCNASTLSFLLFPLGWLLSLRRKIQLKKYTTI